jgi:hypothetical protein
MFQRGVYKMENRKEKKNENKRESALPMLVLLITLGIGMIV